jgi:hypothetical protein
LRKTKAKEIESYLANEKKKYLEYLKEPKVLILGSSDSGKSTLLKQLKIMHGGGFTEKEKDVSKRAIITGIIHTIATLVSLCEVEEKQREYQEMIDFAEQWNVSIVTLDTANLSMMIKVWQDATIKEVFQKQEHGLPDTTEYFLKNLARFLDTEYQPTNDDILNLRTVTQAVNDSTFTIRNSKIHCIFD